MAVFTLTALNWNDVAFWSAINAVNGDTLDMAALPANFTVTYDYTTNSNLQISDGTTTYTIGSAGATGTDVNLASGALDFFDTILMPAGGGNVSLDGDDQTITGAAGADTLDTGAGDDVARGGDGDDSIDGGAGNDNLYGEDGADTIDGGGGSDNIWGGAGADSLSGGAGTDWVRYDDGSSNAVGSGVNIDLSTNTASGGAAQGDTISGFENVWGTSHDDTLTGDAGSNYLRGDDGDDTLSGGAGNDQLIGGVGADSLSGGAGTDWVRYDDGSSNAVGSGVNIDLSTNTASGGAAQGDTISGFENVWGTSHDDTLTGDAGNNHMRGGAGDDNIDGGDGNEWIMGQDGADTLDGGDGIDWLDYIWDTEGVTVDLSTNTASGGEAQGDVISNFEHIRGGRAADNLTGDANDNSFVAGAGDDTIDGGDGNDWISGQAGNDLLTGGAGRDAFRMVAGEGQDTITDFELPDLNITTGTWNSTSGDTLSIGGLLNASGDQVTTDDVTLSDTNGDGTGDVIINFPMGESFTLQGITPSEVNQVAILTAMGIPAGTDDGIVMGGAGNDTIDAAYAGDPDGNVVDGGDALDGSEDDIIHAGDGDDVIFGGAGDDIIVDSNGASSVPGNGNDTFHGGDGDDLIIGKMAGNFADGTVGTNVMYGDAGNDTLVSGNSNETMHGGDGDDLIYTGNVRQTVYGGEGNDTVVGDDESGTAESDTIYGGAGDDELSSGFVGTVNLHHGDFIDGGEGNDTVTGGDADDTLTGGAGDDTIAGGGGQDQIILEDGFGTDIIDGGSTGVDEDTLDAGAMTTGVTVTFSGDEAGTLTDGTNTATFTDIEAVTTGDGDDTILAAQDNTGLTLSSGAGNDNVRGGDGDDTIDGGTGNDTLRGDDGNDSVDGGEGDDSLFGGDGDDSLTGGDGDDRLLGQDGADVIDGGDGVDTAIFNGATATDIDLTDGLAETGGEAEGDTITNIEEFLLSEGDDTFVGDANTTRVSGRDGDDDITTDAGEQALIGGTGNDTLSAGAGDDLIRGQEDDDLIDGGAGEDLLYGDEGSDTIDGGDGRDAIYGGDGADLADGGAGDDILRGGDGDDSLTGGDGGDVLMGDAGNDTLDGGAGSDISIMTSGSGTDTFDGGADDDALVIEGGATGADVTYDGAGSGTADLGTDSTDFSNVETIALGAGDDTLDASLDTAGMTGLGGAGDDSLTGGAGDDVLIGDGGSWAWERFDIDPLTIDGDTTLADVGFTLNGGTDNTNTPDATGFSSAIHPDAIHPGENQAFKFETELTITQGGNYDFSAVADDNVRVFIDGVEIINGDSQQSATFFDSAAQTLTPGTYTIEVIYLQGGTDQALDLRMSGPDTGGESTSLQGYEGVSAPGAVGNDTLNGGDGDDLIDGGAGNDQLRGQGGNNTVFGGDGDDRIWAGDGDDVADGGAGSDTLSGGDGNDSLSGGDGNDTVWGHDGDDTLSGGTGNDVVTGGDGADHISGDAGDDTLKGGAGDDTILGGDGNDQLHAANADDPLFNDLVTDTNLLDGGAGDDTLYGGVGQDTLTGGADNDTFVMADGGNADVITDFDMGDDDSNGFTNDQLDVTGLTSDGGTTPVTTDDVVISDTNGDGSGDAILTFPGGESITLTGVTPAMIPDAATLVSMGIPAGTKDYTVDGTAGNDLINGSYTDADGDAVDGNDNLAGTNDDVIDAGDGNDTIISSAGADIIDGGAGEDFVDYNGETADLTIDLSDGLAESGGNAEGDILTNVEDIRGGSGDDNITGNASDNFLRGASGDDTIDGGAGDDNMIGGGGNDSIIGGDGDDLLYGQLGADTLDGGAGVDQASYVLDNTGINIDLSAGTASGGEAEGDVLTNIEHLRGGSAADTLTGDTAANELRGEGGDDILTGGVGDDTLIGGTGDDTYVFADGSGADVITDFDMGDDDTDGFTNDQLDISGLTDANGDPVNVWDVVITDTNGDGTGDAILTFPNGESITLQGVTPDQVDTGAELGSMGIVCYVSGTMIRTERGEVAVEHLTDYDKVLTAQGGYEPILWRDHTRVTLAQQKAAENLRPVRIKPQALGNDSALFVSQQHCMVVQIEGKDQFIRAKHLAEFTDMAHIAKPKSDVTYHHILLPEHAVIYANGAASESFYPGPQSLKMLSLKAMSSLVTAISPKATEGLAAAYGQRCLETLSRKSVQALQETPTQGVACAALKAGSSHLAERALVQQQ